MKKLAISGGQPVRSQLLPNQSTIGEAEKAAVSEVLDSKILTGYQGNYSDAFYGGPEVRALEREFEKYTGAAHAIAVNSATSGLVVACGAINLRPGDEIIVTPWSMTCSATIPMAWGGVPIFADIEPEHFCLDPDSVRKKITERTRSILAVDLFGQPFDPEIREIAEKHNLKIIEDAAQAIGSSCEGIPAGLLGDVGVFSFNSGKHMECGEGGMIVTNNDALAFRCRLLMNHAEAVVNDMWMQGKSLSLTDGMANMFGFNLRLPEVSAAIARVQLRSLDRWIQHRQIHSAYLQDGIRDIPAIEIPPVRTGCTHTYYCLPFLWHAVSKALIYPYCSGR